MPEARLMVRESLLERCFSRAYVFLHLEVVVGGHGRLINYAIGSTFLVEGAMVRVSTVAASKLVITSVFRPTYRGIMALDNIGHIWHTAVADLDRAPVKDLV